MIDLNNTSFFGLEPIRSDSFLPQIEPLLIKDETILSCFKSLRDYVVFTSKRIITVNAQGITGKKKDFSSLPYSKIQAYSVETAGKFDLDCELELCFSGLGKVKLSFDNQVDVPAICRMISEFVL